MPRKYVKPPDGYEEFKQLPHDKKRERLKEEAADLAYWSAKELKLDQSRIQKKYTPQQAAHLMRQFVSAAEQACEGDISGFTLRLPAEICQGWQSHLQHLLPPKTKEEKTYNPLSSLTPDNLLREEKEEEREEESLSEADDRETIL